jgi:glycosyltransferase involved in cell wall biosynthesis
MIGKTLDCALAQTFKDLEILVVDDGSTDDTEAVLRDAYGSRPEVRYFRKENGGPSSARNHGLREARGDLVACFDSDDLWDPGKLAAQVSLLDRHPEAVLCSCNTRYEGGKDDGQDRFTIDGFDGTPLGLDRPEFVSAIATSSTLVRKERLLEVGGFDESLHFREDWDTWARVLASGPAVFVPEIMVVMCIHGENVRFTADVEKQEDWLRVLEKNRPTLEASTRGRRFLRERRARAHRKIAQHWLERGRADRARPHLLGWWRQRRRRLRPLWMWLRSLVGVPSPRT